MDEFDGKKTFILNLIMQLKKRERERIYLRSEILHLLRIGIIHTHIYARKVTRNELLGVNLHDTINKLAASITRGCEPLRGNREEFNIQR